jgi:hypothetical protein
MPCKILISTTVGWTSTARHAAGFSRAGCTVEALAPKGSPLLASRYVSARHPYRSVFARPSLREAILRAKPDLIVGSDDRAVENLLGLYREAPKDSFIAAVIERSLGTPERYAGMISRETFMRTARGLSIRTPDTVPVASADMLDDCLDIIGLPAVLKADGSWGGEGIAVVKSREEAHAAFRKLGYPPLRARSLARAVKRRDGHWLMAAAAPQRRAVSLQRFIPGRPAASAFACWKGEVVGAIYYDVLCADGAIGPPQVIRRVDCPEIAEATRRVARHFGLSGLHGMDFIRDEAGRVHLLEINPRPTQGGTLPFGPGRDLPAALASCVSPGARPRPAIANDTVVFFAQEWLRDPESAYLKAGHHDVPWDDPVILRACLQDALPAAKRMRSATQGAAQTDGPLALSGSLARS